jgi:hypothetical protein
MWTKFSAAQKYRSDTLSYVRYTLGIDKICAPLDIENPIILSFKPIGEGIKTEYNLNQKMKFYEEMRFFMEMSEREQRIRLAGVIPGLEDFWEYRLGSSAVTVCLAVNEFSWDNMHLPSDFCEDDNVKRILLHTNTIICAVNDLLSIKKEIVGISRTPDQLRICG